jgi:hypothetical protein
METCATEHDGSYAACDVPALVVVEPTLSNAGTNLTVPTHTSTGYSISSHSKAGGDFTITRSAPGNIAYSSNWNLSTGTT